MHDRDENESSQEEDVFEEFDRQPSRDPDQMFNVKNLMCLGILYCKSDPIERVRKFYELL